MRIPLIAGNWKMHKEDDGLINRKLRAALSHGLRSILCVGETKPQRDAGQAEQVVIGQMRWLSR